MSHYNNSAEKKIEGDKTLKGYRTDQKKQFKQIIEDLRGVFYPGLLSNRLVANVKDMNEVNYRDLYKQLNDIKGEMLLNFNSFEEQWGSEVLSSKDREELNIQMAKAANHLDQINFCLQVLERIDTSIQAVSLKKEAARDKVADARKKCETKQITQQVFKEQEKEINNIRDKDILQTYQEAGKRIDLLEKWLDENHPKDKGMALKKLEDYWQLKKKVEEQQGSVQNPRTWKGQKGKSEFKEYQKECQKFESKLDDLNKETERNEQAKAANRAELYRSLFPSEASGSAPLDSKAKGNQEALSFSLRYVQETLQTAQELCGKEVRKLRQSLSKGSDVSWLKHLVAASSSPHHSRQVSDPTPTVKGQHVSSSSVAGHNRSVSVDSKASPSVNRGKENVVGSPLSGSSSHSGQAGQDNKASSSPGFRLSGEVIAAGKTPIVASSPAYTPVPSVLSPKGQKGNDAFFPASSSVSTQPSADAQENQLGVPPVAPPLPVVEERPPQPVAQSVVPAPSLQEQNDNLNIPVPPPLPLPVAVGNKQTNPARTASVENKHTDADQAAPTPREVKKQVNSSTAADGDVIAQIQAKAKARQERMAKKLPAGPVSGNSTSSLSSSTNVSATTQLAGEGAHEAKSSPQKAPAPSVRFSGNSTSSSSFSTNVSAATQEAPQGESFLNNQDLRQHGAAALANRRQGVEEPHSPSDDAWDGEPPVQSRILV